MGRMIFRTLIVLGLLVLGMVVLPYTSKLVMLSGVLTSSSPHFAGSCQKIEGIAGAEDITIDKQTGLAFIAAQDRRATTPIRGSGQDAPRGGIYALDLAAASPIPRNITPEMPEDFQPHGISLFRQRDEIYVFAVNHPLSDASVHNIVLFRMGAEGMLEWQETFTHADFITPNDVAAVALDKFYFSNDTHPPSAVFRDGSLLYYDSGEVRMMDSGVGFGNGVQISNDGSEVYFAASTGRNVHIYNRDVESGALTKRQVFSMPSGVDNIEVDKEGQLWIGAHARMFDFLAHATEGALAPSQVFRLDPKTGVYEEVYYNDGEELSGSAVAAVWQDKMLIGPVFDPHFLLCERQ